MQEFVTITIKYFGYFVQTTHKTQEEYKADCVLKNSSNEIIKYLDSEYGIKPPFNAMLNGRHIQAAINQEYMLKGGEVLCIIPYISGG